MKRSILTVTLGIGLSASAFASYDWEATCNWPGGCYNPSGQSHYKQWMSTYVGPMYWSAVDGDIPSLIDESDAAGYMNYGGIYGGWQTV